MGAAPPAEGDGNVRVNVQVRPVAGVRVDARGHIHGQHLGQREVEELNHLCELPAQAGGAADAGDGVDGQHVVPRALRHRV